MPLLKLIEDPTYDGDIFIISYQGASNFQIIQRVNTLGNSYGYIEDAVEPDLTNFYLAVQQWIGLAQSEYLESIVPPASASASNPLSDQSQLVYDVLLVKMLVEL